MCAYNPGIQSIGGQLIGQGILQAGQALGQGIQQYRQSKDMAAKATAQFEGAAQANPEILQYLNSDKSHPDIKNAYNKLQKGGQVGFQDAAKLATFASSYVSNKQEQQQAQLRQQAIDRYSQEQAAQQRGDFLARQLAQFQGGQGRGFLAPSAQANMLQQLGTPEGRLAASTYQYTGRGPTGGDIADIMRTRMANEAKLAEAAAKGPGNLPQNHQSIGPIVDEGGAFLGIGSFDQTSGQVGLPDGKGGLKPIPAGARPITATGLNKSVVDAPTFRKYKADATDAEISLKAMDKYMDSVGGANQGFERLADQFSAGMKTLTDPKGKNPLTQEEMNQALASGRLQGLLGKIRTSVLGPGPMTEQDAARLVSRLGGDVGALQNKEQVRQAMSDIYADRYRQYQDDVNFYNAAVKDYWGAHKFKEMEPVEFSKNFGGVATPATAPTAATDATNPFAGKTTEELQAELAALKAGGKKP